MRKPRTKHIILWSLVGALVVYSTLYIGVDIHRRKTGRGRKRSPDMHIRVLTDNQDELNTLRNSSIVKDLRKYNLESMSEQQLLLIIHSYLDNADILCGRKVRMGNIGSGGWEICDDVNVRPTPPCLFYSFGVNYDFSFEDDVARLYGCHVYSFDPDLEKMESRNRSSHVHFLKVGLSNETMIERQLYSFSDLLKLLGHKKSVIDVIKMDIQGREWSSLPQVLYSVQFANVRQLLVEFHISVSKHNYILKALRVLQAVERAGFRKFLVNKNPACATKNLTYPLLKTQCYEVHYLKR